MNHNDEIDAIKDWAGYERHLRGCQACQNGWLIILTLVGLVVWAAYVALEAV